MACPKCHKLELVKNITAFSSSGKKRIRQCQWQEFPNHPNPLSRKPCHEQLGIFISGARKSIIRPRMLYPKPSIISQLFNLYQRPGFETMLEKSGARYSKTSLYTDIYDGRIWKTFLNAAGSNQFFTKETATTHLGILLNLDWFQPFTHSKWSTGAIYASILNLPREERNKSENLLYLGFLPGPNEASLHQINHYISLIVDELLVLWNGYQISRTYHHPEGLLIQAAVIISANDTPAARKISGHAGAAKKCHRCLKRTQHHLATNHYGRFTDIKTWN